MTKMKMETPNQTAGNIEKIGALFPSCITESKDTNGQLRKAVNFELLRQLLSEDVVEGNEAYEFTWVGKKAAIVEANRPIRKTLRPCPEESVDWDTTENLYIEGDNLEVLKLLQESYLGEVKMIYIDPPYNTGNDFIYKDDYRKKNSEYEEEAGVVDEGGNRLYKNTDSNGRFHSDWCSMVYPRLLLARNLLSDDGMIFISIDDNEISSLRSICDEIFGIHNFIAQITLLCNPKGRSQDKYIANCHEYVVIYSKSTLPSGSLSIPKTQKEIENDYTQKDHLGLYRELELRNTHREFGRFNRKNLWYPFFVSKSGEIFLEEKQDTVAVYPLWDDGFEGCWTWGKEKVQKELHLLTCRMINGKYKIFRKSYAGTDVDHPLKQVKSIWTDASFFTEKGQLIFNTLFHSKTKLFQSPKSLNMLINCILMSQASDAIVLDFFSGSATTAHAVMQLNAERMINGSAEGVNLENGGGEQTKKSGIKYIMVQLPEPCDEKSEAYKAGYKNICEIGKERIRRAGKKIKDENPLILGDLDTGFRVFKLDDTNMNDVYYAPGDYSRDLLEQTEDNIKHDRTDLDLLFGCLLDWGVTLSDPYESIQIEGHTVHNYNDGDLIACFDKNVPESVIKKIAKMNPERVVFRESCFKDSAAKINVEQIFKMLAPDMDVEKNLKVI